MTHNMGVYAVRGIGGLKNEVQRNVKPDLPRTVPRDQTTFKLLNFCRQSNQFFPVNRPRSLPTTFEYLRRQEIHCLSCPAQMPI